MTFSYCFILIVHRADQVVKYSLFWYETKSVILNCICHICIYLVDDNNTLRVIEKTANEGMFL